MELTVSPRARERKKEAKRLRREGKIPAVLYERGKESHKIVVDGGELAAHMRQIPKGGLATTVFELKGKGSSVRAVVKGIQYDVTSYDIIHLDFEELKKGREVTVRAPIRLRGTADCVGVKLGGVLRPVTRAVPVRCKPDKIPEALEIDVREMAIGQSRRLRDTVIPEGVRLLASEDEVAVVVAKR